MFTFSTENLKSSVWIFTSSQHPTHLEDLSLPRRKSLNPTGSRSSCEPRLLSRTFSKPMKRKLFHYRKQLLLDPVLILQNLRNRPNDLKSSHCLLLHPAHTKWATFGGQSPCHSESDKCQVRQWSKWSSQWQLQLHHQRETALPSRWVNCRTTVSLNC